MPKRKPTESATDCPTCTRRQAEHAELRKTARCVSLGAAYCQECGEKYQAIAEASEDE